MDEIIFEWDSVKAELNYTKHKVTFEEAKSVFYDENAILIPKEIHRLSLWCGEAFYTDSN